MQASSPLPLLADLTQVLYFITVHCRNDTERRLTLNVIGPTWDGNQVWLIAAVVPYLLFGHWSIARLFLAIMLQCY
nr:cytochrome d ubiquinol oxidase subunit II [Piscirickettsia salmonis]